MSATRRARPDTDAIRSEKQSLVAHGTLNTSHADWLDRGIDRSWRRSITAGARLQPGDFHYVNDFDTNSELCRAARPILDRLQGITEGLDTSIFLADQSGQIVARRVPSRRERARFDNACAAEGFDFSESSIGTNGLGTAMKEHDAVFVRGPEHFNQGLEQLACAGVAIRHPNTGRLVGSLSLAAAADEAEAMMLALVREGARQIVDNLGDSADRREVALGRTYREHRNKGPVIVLNADTVMTNVTGLSFLNVESHARLWDMLIGEDWSAGSCDLDLDLPSLRAHARAYRLDDLADEPAFAVEIVNRGTGSGSGAGSGARKPQSDSFADHVAEVLHRSSAVSVTGPSGSGKLFVALGALRAMGAPTPLVLDAGDLGSEGLWRSHAASAMNRGQPVVLRRVEDLAGDQLNAVKALADQATNGSNRSSAPPMLIVTADETRCTATTMGVLAYLVNAVQLPPLACRAEDIPGIVESLLVRLGEGRRTVLSAATMQVLLRWHWPGNIAELSSLVNDLGQEYPGRVVSPYHLPDHMWDAANRRTMTRIEAATRSEIVAALNQSDGNRSRAATLLGIGRTTLYRKMRTLGIDDESMLPSLRGSIGGGR